eukprot:m.79190 g.79190  ORF g.79190 m.79190 type:complete len:62 (-) comp8595_c2_seq1:2396-2581(-)
MLFMNVCVSNSSRNVDDVPMPLSDSSHGLSIIMLVLRILFKIATIIVNVIVIILTKNLELL